MTKSTTPRILGLAIAAVLMLSGCASGATSAGEPKAAPAADSLTIAEPWVKAAPEGMSAAFGVLKNSGDADIDVVSAATTASTSIQLHETVANDAGEMIMQEKKGGFVVPAGGSFELAPGGNHIMLMGLTDPLAAGSEAAFTLTLSDGSTYKFIAPAKDYSGANETYEGDMDMDMGTDMDTDK